jgi:hypothetical protein
MELDPESRRQRALLTSPTPYIRLDRPCTLGDGILRIPEAKHASLEAVARSAAINGRISSFVPASGAATRMFAGVTATRAGSASDADRQRIRHLLDQAPSLALYDELVAHGLPERATPEATLDAILDPATALVDRPKGLVPFHRYPDGVRTAFEEHLVESAELCADRCGVTRAHFTVSDDAVAAFEAALLGAQHRFFRYGTFDVGFSVQDPDTDTIAVNADGSVVTVDGVPLRRPGGHGALLRNLEQHGHDVVIVKNVDNVVPDTHRAPILDWRRRLIGWFLELEALVHAVVRGEVALNEARPRLAALGVSLASDAHPRDLHRPIRVAGMVRNEGKPGGGPFFAWSLGRCAPQIVESAQVDPRDPASQAVVANAGWFNPVDLVCGLRDAWGARWRLAEHADPDAVIVTEKQHENKKIRVLEHPGLWNGAMAGWLSVFVDVPSETFHPVKSVTDLLDRGHR